MAYKHIIYEPGKVARIILNRPEYHNAQSWLMREEMDNAFNAAMADDEVCVVVLSGKGDNFSAGHDIGTKEDQEYRESIGKISDDRVENFHLQREICLENTLRWRNLPKPTIAMVRGYCIFGGWMFAAAMDIIFASENARFLPSLTQYFSAPWDLGPRKAKEILYEHRYLTGKEAAANGFVNRVYADDELEEATLAYAEKVVENFRIRPHIIKQAKFLINQIEDGKGFSTSVENAYAHYFLGMDLTLRGPLTPKGGGLARTDQAKKNLEDDKKWLEDNDLF